MRDFGTPQVVEEMGEARDDSATAPRRRPVAGARGMRRARGPVWPWEAFQVPGDRLAAVSEETQRQQNFRAPLKTTPILSSRFNFFFPVYMCVYSALK